MNQKIKTKLAASGIHFLISAIVISVLLAVILLIWYPNNLFLAGANTGLTILVSVDLVLGPLLTLVVYNESKKSLKFDLTVIVIIQLAFFIYGTYLIYNERPVIQVLADDGVNLITLNEAKDYGMNDSFSVFAKPAFVLMRNPESKEELKQAKALSEIVDSRPYVSKFELHKPITQVTDIEYVNYIQYVYDGLLGTELSKLNSMNSNNTDKRCDWVPVISRHANGYACISKQTGIEKFIKSK